MCPLKLCGSFSYFKREGEGKRESIGPQDTKEYCVYDAVSAREGLGPGVYDTLFCMD